MPFPRGAILRILPLLVFVPAALAAHAAQGGNAGMIAGTVTDPSGAVIPGATVRVSNQMSGFERATTTNAAGQFTVTNVPFNPYSITVSAKGFAPTTQSVEIRSTVETTLTLVLQIEGASQTVTVESEGPQVEDTSTYHTDVDRDVFSKIPIESQSSGLSSVVTQTVPGISADSNGQMHGLGDHASNSISLDGQNLTDQTSKVFSNQLPTNAIQSLEVISGAPPAEYGDKTSLVIVATTRSGQGVTTPTGAVYGSYGSFGSAAGGFTLSYGGKSWGNFVEADGLNTGRFLDAPEFDVFHDKGNEENLFDRVDYNLTQADSLHLDLNYSRSWFQTPNTFDNLNVQNVVSGGTSASPVFDGVGNADQRSKIGTFNISPTYTRVINNYSVLNLGAFVRKDLYNYFPSGNALADLGPSNLQTSSIAQVRSLVNTAVHADWSYDRGINNVKIGAQYGQTFLRESDALGIVDNIYNAPCMNASGNPLPGYAAPSDCLAPGVLANPDFVAALAPYDLTRGGSLYDYLGRTDVKELALYAEDEIKTGPWDFNLGLREDVYNGLTDANQTEPRLGVAYNVKPTTTVLGISYARTLETPFNENLVLSSEGCGNAVLAPLLNCASGVSTVMAPGYRNEFHASLQQGIGKNVVVSGEYIWKYTHNAFDFSVLGNTPITFPIDWHNSKIPGYALHVEVPNFHNFSAYSVMSSVSARFYPPQVAGAGATGGVSQGTVYPFRIDHDERFNQNAHVQYTIAHDGWWNNLWSGFNWRYDSGLVAGSTPCYNVTDPNSSCPNTSVTLPNGQQETAMLDNNIPATANPVTGAPVALPLSADEEFEAGLTCGGDKATPTHLIGTAIPGTSFTSPSGAVSSDYECPANELTSSLIRIPAPGTGDNDHNPPRIAPRNLFDVSIGKNNIFHREHFKTDLDLTAINVTDKYALYNFLSTFSGTHYVTPRTMTAKVTLNF
jgi:hypothetical protein